MKLDGPCSLPCFQNDPFFMDQSAKAMKIKVHELVGALFD